MKKKDCTFNLKNVRIQKQGYSLCKSRKKKSLLTIRKIYLTNKQNLQNFFKKRLFKGKMTAFATISLNNAEIISSIRYQTK